MPQRQVPLSESNDFISVIRQATATWSRCSTAATLPPESLRGGTGAKRRDDSVLTAPPQFHLGSSRDEVQERISRSSVPLSLACIKRQRRWVLNGGKSIPADSVAVEWNDMQAAVDVRCGALVCVWSSRSIAGEAHRALSFVATRIEALGLSSLFTVPVSHVFSWMGRVVSATWLPITAHSGGDVAPSTTSYLAQLVDAVVPTLPFCGKTSTNDPVATDEMLSSESNVILRLLADGSYMLLATPRRLFVPRNTVDDRAVELHLSSSRYLRRHVFETLANRFADKEELNILHAEDLLALEEQRLFFRNEHAAEEDCAAAAVSATRGEGGDDVRRVGTSSSRQPSVLSQEELQRWNHVLSVSLHECGIGLQCVLPLRLRLSSSSAATEAMLRTVLRALDVQILTKSLVSALHVLAANEASIPTDTMMALCEEDDRCVAAVPVESRSELSSSPSSMFSAHPLVQAFLTAVVNTTCWTPSTDVVKDDTRSKNTKEEEEKEEIGQAHHNTNLQRRCTAAIEELLLPYVARKYDVSDAVAQQWFSSTSHGEFLWTHVGEIACYAARLAGFDVVVSRQEGSPNTEKSGAGLHGNAVKEVVCEPCVTHVCHSFAEEVDVPGATTSVPEEAPHSDGGEGATRDDCLELELLRRQMLHRNERSDDLDDDGDGTSGTQPWWRVLALFITSVSRASSSSSQQTEHDTATVRQRRHWHVAVAAALQLSNTAGKMPSASGTSPPDSSSLSPLWSCLFRCFSSTAARDPQDILPDAVVLRRLVAALSESLMFVCTPLTSPTARGSEREGDTLLARTSYWWWTCWSPWIAVVVSAIPDALFFSDVLQSEWSGRATWRLLQLSEAVRRPEASRGHGVQDKVTGAHLEPVKPPETDATLSSRGSLANSLTDSNPTGESAPPGKQSGRRTRQEADSPNVGSKNLEELRGGFLEEPARDAVDTFLVAAMCVLASTATSSAGSKLDVDDHDISSSHGAAVLHFLMRLQRAEGVSPKHTQRCSALALSLSQLLFSVPTTPLSSEFVQTYLVLDLPPRFWSTLSEAQQLLSSTSTTPAASTPLPTMEEESATSRQAFQTTQSSSSSQMFTASLASLVACLPAAPLRNPNWVDARTEPILRATLLLILSHYVRRPSRVKVSGVSDSAAIASQPPPPQRLASIPIPPRTTTAGAGAAAGAVASLPRQSRGQPRSSISEARIERATPLIERIMRRWEVGGSGSLLDDDEALEAYKSTLWTRVVAVLGASHALSEIDAEYFMLDFRLFGVQTEANAAAANVPQRARHEAAPFSKLLYRAFPDLYQRRAVLLALLLTSARCVSLLRESPQPLSARSRSTAESVLATTFLLLKEHRATPLSEHKKKSDETNEYGKDDEDDEGLEAIRYCLLEIATWLSLSESSDECHLCRALCVMLIREYLPPLELLLASVSTPQLVGADDVRSLVRQSVEWEDRLDLLLPSDRTASSPSEDSFTSDASAQTLLRLLDALDPAVFDDMSSSSSSNSALGDRTRVAISGVARALQRTFATQFGVVKEAVAERQRYFLPRPPSSRVTGTKRSIVSDGSLATHDVTTVTRAGEEAGRRQIYAEEESEWHHNIEVRHRASMPSRLERQLGEGIIRRQGSDGVNINECPCPDVITRADEPHVVGALEGGDGDGSERVQTARELGAPPVVRPSRPGPTEREALDNEFCVVSNDELLIPGDKTRRTATLPQTSPRERPSTQHRHQEAQQAAALHVVVDEEMRLRRDLLSEQLREWHALVEAGRIDRMTATQWWRTEEERPFYHPATPVEFSVDNSNNQNVIVTRYEPSPSGLGARAESVGEVHHLTKSNNSEATGEGDENIPKLAAEHVALLEAAEATARGAITEYFDTYWRLLKNELSIHGGPR